MPQREYACLGEQITAEAWEAFEKFCRAYDPEGNMETVDLVEAYGRTCEDLCAAPVTNEVRNP